MCKLTYEAAMQALEDLKNIRPPSGRLYYFHGRVEYELTGITLEEVVEYFKDCSDVIVVDARTQKMYRRGEPYIREAECNGKKCDASDV